MYTEHAGEYARATLDNVFNAHYERPSLLHLIGDVSPGSSVLDLGCGPGYYTRHFHKNRCHVTALDLSDEMVELVRQDLGDEVRCYRQDLASGLPDEKDARFDLVLSALTLHYLEDWRAPLNAVSRVLKPGGVFAFSTHHPMVDFSESPSGDYFSVEQIEEDWNTIGYPVKVRFYRRPLSSLFDELAKAGLRVDVLSEGSPDPVLEEKAPEAFERLRSRPCFLFFKCSHIPQAT